MPRTGTGPWLPRLAAGNFSAKQATGGARDGSSAGETDGSEQPMVDVVPDRVRKAADCLEENAEAAEQIGRLPNATLEQATALRVVHIQPKELGGYRSHLSDFLGAAMAVPSGSGLGWRVTSFRIPGASRAGRMAGRCAAAETSGSS